MVVLIVIKFNYSTDLIFAYKFRVYVNILRISYKFRTNRRKPTVQFHALACVRINWVFCYVNNYETRKEG